VPTGAYLNQKFLLKLPTVDTICKIINSFNTPVSLFKIDLSRAFRQLPLDPLDAACLGVTWRGQTYIDNALPFGWRHRSAACQRVTDAVRYILKKHDIIVGNYIDDFISIVPVSDAHRAFSITKQILYDIGLVTSDEKKVPPTCECACLGIIINTNSFTLSIPKPKLKTIVDMCKNYKNLKKITKNQIQSLLGSLIYINKAIYLQPGSLLTEL
jgi:hypothetical protein